MVGIRRGLTTLSRATKLWPPLTRGEWTERSVPFGFPNSYAP
jgi:hypothetical protein